MTLVSDQVFYVTKSKLPAISLRSLGMNIPIFYVQSPSTHAYMEKFGEDVVLTQHEAVSNVTSNIPKHKGYS